MIQTISESPLPQPTPYNHLRLCILRSNRRHVGMSLLWSEFIHGLLLHRYHNFVLFIYRPLYLPHFTVYLIQQNEVVHISLVLLVLFLAFSFFIVDSECGDKEFYLLRNILFFSCIIQCFAPIHSVVMRVNYYFLIFIPVIIPKSISLSSENNKTLSKCSAIFMTVFFLMFFVYRGFTGSDILQVFPYIPYWESTIV